jgi:hypothetical protein
MIKSHTNSVGLPFDAREKRGAFGHDDRDQSNSAWYSRPCSFVGVKRNHHSVHAHQEESKKRSRLLDG